MTNVTDPLRSFVNTVLPQHPRLLVLTGAGCSTASGIPDYRDERGEWKRAAPMHFPEFMASDDKRKRYWARSMAGWRAFSRATPNAVHEALATLEAQQVIHHLLTQNVDGLHQRAGSRRVVDLHGRLDAVLCLDCGAQFERRLVQEQLEAENPDWAYEVKQIAPDGDVDLDQVDYPRFKLVYCDRCGGILKPNVVFFGENVPRSRVDFALARLHEADALVVVGSSLMVYSGFRFARAAAQAQIPIVILNRGQTRADDLAILKLDQDVGLSLQQLTRVVGELI
jgi:NAD-dependent SIR2 family protein deacetylase